MPKEEFQLVPYDLELATIEGLKAKYMDITIPPEDKAAYAMVMGGLRECRDLLRDADDWHKDKKALILKAGRHYDGEKNRVHGLVEPIQDHLKAVRKVEDDRVEAIQAEKIRLEQERVAGIRAKIQAIRDKGELHFLFGKTRTEIQGIVGSLMEIPPTPEVFAEFAEETRKALTETMTILEDTYQARLEFDQEEAGKKAQEAAAHAELDRLQALAKAESERLEKVRAEQEAEAAKLKAAQDKIDKDARKVAADKAALDAEKKAEQERKDRLEFEAKAKEDARIKAENDAREKAEREARENLERAAREIREAKEKADAEAEEKARQEALRPDKEKILTWARELNQRLMDLRPDLESVEARVIMGDAEEAIDAVVSIAVKRAKEL